MSSGKSSGAVGKRESRGLFLWFSGGPSPIWPLGVVAKIQPLMAIPVGWATSHCVPGSTSIHAADENVGFVSPGFRRRSVALFSTLGPKTD
jgi:hypothetical protein